MEITFIIAGLIAGLVVGGLFSWFLGGALKDKERAEILNPMKVKLAESETENKTLESTNQRLRGEFEALNADLRDAQEREVNLSEDRAFVTESKKSISKIQQELERAGTRILDLQDKIAELRGENHLLRTTIEKNAEVVKERESEFEDGKARLALEAQKSMSKVEQELEKTKIRIDEFIDENTGLRSSIQLLQTTQGHKAEETNDLKERLSEEKNTVSESKKAFTKLEKEFSSTRIRTNELETENANLKKWYEELDASKGNEVKEAKEKEERLKDELKAAALESKEAIAEIKQKLDTTKAEIEELQNKNIELKKREIGLMTSKEKQTAEIDEKLALLEDTKKKMHESFEDLFKNALRENHEAFMGIADKKLDPFRNLLDEFNSHIQELEGQRQEAYNSVTEQLKNMSQTQDTLKTETNKLAQALRPPRMGGEWGKIQLEQAVEIAGIKEYCEFTGGDFMKSGESIEGPDLIIRLPRGGVVIVDTKVPTEAFSAYIEAEDNEEKDRLLNEHAENVRGHIEILASEDYGSHLEQTPEFVLMFIPSESTYFAALQKAPDLIREAADKRVLITPPTSFIALLKTIAVGWREALIAENTKKISELGEELYDRIAKMGAHFDVLGKNLKQSVDTYNKTVGSFELRVLSSARRFQDLSDKPTAELPEVSEIELFPRKLRAPEFTIPHTEPKELTEGMFPDEDKLMDGDELPQG